MSTRALIGISHGDEIKAVYHHFDGHPTWLGKKLFKLRNGHFKGDTVKMMRVLIEDHSAGWSSIEGDWKLKPGYAEDYKPLGKRQKDRRPHCYCHGDRQAESQVYTLPCEDELWDIAYVYVINTHTHVMYVNAMCKDNHLELLGRVDLNGPEPQWKAMKQDS